MQWLFAALAGIGFVELMIRLPLLPTLAQFNTTVERTIAVIGSDRISDHWKSKVLPRYASQLFKMTMLIALYLLAALIPFFLLYAISIVLAVPFLEFAMSWIGIVIVTVIAAAYAKVRSARVPAKL